MHCGVMVTGYNQGDWERLLAEDYTRPPAVSDAANMDDTLYLGELVEFGATDNLFLKPRKKETEDYITGRFG